MLNSSSGTIPGLLHGAMIRSLLDTSSRLPKIGRGAARDGLNHFPEALERLERN